MRDGPRVTRHPDPVQEADGRQGRQSTIHSYNHKDQDGQTMLIRTTVAVTCVATLLAACAPGPWLDKSRLQDDLDAKTSTEVYPVQPITADVIMPQVRKVAIEQASSLPSDTAAWDYHVGTDDILGVT